MADTNQIASDADALPAAAGAADTSEGVDAAAAGTPALAAAAEAPSAAVPSAEKGQDIDLSEIETYLKNLVPGVLKMSETLLSLSSQFQRMTSTLEGKVKETDQNIRRYDMLLVKKNKLVQMTLLGSLGAVFLALTMMLVAGFNYSRQVNSMNTLSVALAGRLSEVNSGLVTFEQLNQSIARLNTSMERMQLMTESQTDTLAEGLTEIAAQGATATAAVEQSLVNLQSAIENGVRAGVVEQEALAADVIQALQGLESQQQALRDATVPVRELMQFSEQLEALITLERARFLEAIAQADAARNPAPPPPAAAPEVDTSLRYQRPASTRDTPRDPSLAQ
ncbi:MAG: hypothetical protein RL572_682 [Pseudomonadota bacterium]|jgi:hypothetical protein